jgi:cell division protein FtsB
MSTRRNHARLSVSLIVPYKLKLVAVDLLISRVKFDQCNGNGQNADWFTMKILTELRLRSRHIIGPIIGVCLMVYFVYHAVQGDRGLIAFWQLSKQVTKAENTRSILSHKRVELQNRVALLNPYSLNGDMLEERARLMLGYSRSDEIVIFRN